MAKPTRGQVKLSGDYEWIENADPTAAEKAPTYSAGERWLALTSGDSFVLTDAMAGTWAQIERALDWKIDDAIDPTWRRVFAECRDALMIQRQEAITDAPASIRRTDWYYLQTFESAFAKWSISGDTIAVSSGDEDDIAGGLEQFEYEDTIAIVGSRRNDGPFEIEAVNADGLQLDSVLADGEDERFLVALIDGDQADLNRIIARMIYFDVVLRPARFGVRTERIGAYSYTLADTMVAGLLYPADVVAGIDSYLSGGPIADAEYTP